ncbi:MAG: elongation factor 1-beta family protein, partial [Candidatus Thermoplasmatota archaeon]|nr:elongation factor 1-beta family protein [Candidatus Thermoplasmatota archaeon]
NNKEYSIEPVAFGLKSITVFFFYPDDKSTEHLEEEFTIEARIFILRENFTESTPVLGRGYFVRIT